MTCGENAHPLWEDSLGQLVPGDLCGGQEGTNVQEEPPGVSAPGSLEAGHSSRLLLAIGVSTNGMAPWGAGCGGGFLESLKNLE